MSAPIKGRSFRETGPECYAPPGLAVQAHRHAAPAQSANVPGGSTVAAGSRYGPPTMGRVVRRVALFLLVAAVVPATAGAVVERPFVPRYSTNDQGAIWVTGSTLETCPAAAADCAASQAGTATGAALSNNNFAMVPRRRRRGSRHVQLVELDVHAAGRQPGAVRGACTGAGGRARAGAAQPAAPNPAARGTALLQTPASAATTRSPAPVADSAAVAGVYVAFADVTALVSAQAARVATRSRTSRAGTGVDRYAGWALVVVYRDLALPLRNLDRVRRARDDRAERAAAADRRERLPDAAQRARAHLGRARRLRGRPRQRRRPAPCSTAAT